MSIKIRELSKSYGDEEVLKDFNMEMEKGEILEIRGETGRGKTTLKRCISGLEDHQGEIEIDGELAYVFQNERVLPWLNVRKNITTPLKLKEGNVSEKKKDEIEILAQKFGVKKHLNKKIEEVSGGQLQRILLIRALITDPDLLLLDEPFNSLDQDKRDEIYSEVTDICSNRDISVLIASHTDNAKEFADRTIYLGEQRSN